MSDQSELYQKHQALFNRNFENIMIKLFAGFERSTFDSLAKNDPEKFDEWQEGDIQYFSDGTPAIDEE